jgi:folate-binding protein YgfZ
MIHTGAANKQGHDDNHPMNAFSLSTAIPTLPDAMAWSGITVLDQLVPVLAEGADAVSFLQNQFTQDVQTLPADHFRLGGYCSAKGRMQASFYLLKPKTDQVVLLADASLLPAWLKRLQMFVLRAKVTLQDARPAWQVLGVVGQAQGHALFGEVANTLPVGSVAITNGMLLRLPDVLGQMRWIWLGPTADAAALLKQGAPLTVGVWPWLDVMSGVPRITADTVDQFVPQMINFELLGGVNFQKGCYPGQEVVARSQYRGTVKRRLFLLHATEPMHAMQDIYAAADPEQPAGVVVNAAAMPQQAGWSALVELKLAHVKPDTTLHLVAPNGPMVSIGSLPYGVPTEAEA